MSRRKNQKNDTRLKKNMGVATCLVEVFITATSLFSEDQDPYGHHLLLPVCNKKTKMSVESSVRLIRVSIPDLVDQCPATKHRFKHLLKA